LGEGEGRRPVTSAFISEREREKQDEVAVRCIWTVHTPFGGPDSTASRTTESKKFIPPKDPDDPDSWRRPIGFLWLQHVITDAGHSEHNPSTRVSLRRN
jgi:hypothetical protein